MMLMDIAVVLIAVIFVVIGMWKGFFKLMAKLGAFVPAVVLSRLFGGFLGITLFPQIISDDSKIAEKISYSSLDNINTSLAKILGTLILFVVLYITFKIILSVVTKMIKKDFRVTLFDRILGAIFGLVIALGAVYVMAFVVNIVAMVITFINSESSIYGMIEETVIFRHFF